MPLSPTHGQDKLVKNIVELVADLNALLTDLGYEELFRLHDFVTPEDYPYEASLGQHVESSGDVVLPLTSFSGGAVSVTASAAVTVTAAGGALISGQNAASLVLDENAVFYWSGTQWRRR